jgi:membrane fusion protein (multidrug efflux system)
MHTFFRHTLLALALLLAGCGPKTSGPPLAAPGPPPPMEVGVITIKTEQVTLTQELPGRISAIRVAEVRARVNGIVLKRLFKEGSDVKEGQVLYEIDSAQYEAALDSAQGTLARAEAGLNSARLKLDRMKSLIDSHAVSKQPQCQ